MDLRNVQRTGNMFYVYLPTSWCKQWNISSHSHVQLSMTSDGKLQISPTVGEEKPKHIEMSIDEDDLDIINKLVDDVQVILINSTSKCLLMRMTWTSSTSLLWQHTSI